MTDNRIIVLLTRKVAKVITPVETEELKQLLEKYPDAVYYDEFLKELWKGPYDAIDKDTEAAYQQHKQKHFGDWFFEPDPRSFKRKPRALSIYASLTLVLCIICLSIFIIKQNGIKNNFETDRRTEVVAEKGVRKQLSLPDGTKIWLNADSRLFYNNFSKTGKRLVQLEGEAYFDVAEDKDKPFIIETNKISIQVLGTAFNVKAYPGDKKTETTLIKGAIELSVNERPNEKIRLRPSEKLAVIDQGAGQLDMITVTIGNLSKIHVENKEYIQETSWINNKLVFKDETMAELIPKIERWYNVRIQLKNSKVGTYRYTGTITKENVHQVFDAMQLIRSFNYKIENNEVTIY